MNNRPVITSQRLGVTQRIAAMLASSLIIAVAIPASPLMAAEKDKNSTQAVTETVPVPISKVDIHAADLSTQPNMRSTGVMVDAEGRIHVLCVDPSTPQLASRLQTRVQATHQTISDR